MLAFGIVSAVVLALLVIGCVVLCFADSVGAVVGTLLMVFLAPAAVYNGMSLCGTPPAALGIVGIVLMSVVMLAITIFGLVVSLVEEEAGIFLACLVPVLLAIVPLVYVSMAL